MPTLQQLRYLVAVADTLHFRRAAEMTGVTQPTLSGQLRELEQKLGVQLVERSRARVVLPIGNVRCVDRFSLSPVVACSGTNHVLLLFGPRSRCGRARIDVHRHEPVTT